MLTKEKDISEVLKLLDAIATSPVYLLKLDEPKRELEKLLIIDSRNKLAEAKSLLLKYPTTVFYCKENDKENLNTEALFRLLSGIYYGPEAAFSVADKKKPTNCQPLIPETDDARGKESVVREILEKNLEGKTVLEIILDILLVLVENKMRTISYHFNLNNMDNRQMRPDQYRIYDINIMFVPFQSVASIVVILHDRSSRLIMSNLEAQNHSVGQALSSLTHDMRAPLHAILGFVENMTYKISLSDSSNKKALSKCKKISAYCQYLSMLVNDILNSARLANGKFNFTIAQFDFASLAEECIELTKTMQNNPNVSFKYCGPKCLKIVSDSHRLKRILLDLLYNSIKYTDNGSIRIHTEQIDTLVEIRVIDAGKGIDKNIQCNLFNQYISFGDDVEGKQGVGLGLTTTRDLVDKLGPSSVIGLESEIGAGSAFSFSIFQNLQSVENRRKMESEKNLTEGNNMTSDDPVIHHMSSLNKRNGLLRKHRSGGEKSL